MSDDKYEILYEDPVTLFGKKLYRIISKKSFYTGCKRVAGSILKSDIGVAVRAGEVGGFVEGSRNLSQKGFCWIGKGAAVFGKACVAENAYVHGIERSGGLPTVTVRDFALIFGNCEVRDFAEVRDLARAGGCSVIRQYARLEDRAVVIDADVGGHAHLFDEVFVKGADKIIDFNSRPARIANAGDLESALRSAEEARENKCENLKNNFRTDRYVRNNICV